MNDTINKKEIKEVVKYNPPLTHSEWQNLGTRQAELPSIWAEKHFKLTTAYARPGRLILQAWQREPVNAISKYESVILCGCVQTGKSLIAEAIMAWIIDCNPMNAMVCYAKSDTVRSVFDERLKPMITEIPAIRRYWNGASDNLTQKKMTLSHMILRVASSEVKSDIATFSAGFVYASEVAKYKVSREFDQVKELYGRQEGYKILGIQKAVFESSPEEEGDPLFNLMYKRGVRNCEPFVPCPRCKAWFIMQDENIKELPNKENVFDHNPERIRLEKAARLVCPVCGGDILNDERRMMLEKVIWADPRERIDEQGNILNEIKSKTVSFQWNRLVDFSFSISECLARFFEAKQSPNPAALKTYQNIDMGRFAKKEASRQMSTKWLHSKLRPYTQYGENRGYPNEVLVLTCGIDTQDNGFYVVVRGWGRDMESWLILHDFLPCSIKDEEFKNPENVLALIRHNLVEVLPKRKDGILLPITAGFIDRGGHRQKQVDFVCSRLPFLSAYVGTVDKRAVLLKPSKTGNFYLGHTENLSRMVEKYSESDMWHLPEDVTEDYCAQFVRQYAEEKIDRNGNTKIIWVHGGNDHYRDSENYNIAAAEKLQLARRMFSEIEVDRIKLPKVKIEEQAEALPERPKKQATYLQRYRSY